MVNTPKNKPTNVNDENILVQQAMRTVITLLTPEMTFRDALKVFILHNMESTAVVESRETKKLVGVLSMYDLIKKAVPDYLEYDTTAATFEPGDFFARVVGDVADEPIKNFMTTDVHAVHADHSLIEVAALIARHNLRSVPVVDEHTSEVVGYISRRDIKQAMGRVLFAKRKEG